jgi:Do/DeqQ family serine protease
MKIKFISCVFFSLSVLMAPAAFAENALLNTAVDNNNLPGMLKKVMPSVVNIMVTGEISVMVDPNSFKNVLPDGVTIDPDATPEQAGGLLPIKRKFTSVGSGFVADAASGYIITNAHVVKDSKMITVTLTDGRKFLAKLIGADPQSDLAVLQVKPDHLTSIQFADSDNVKVGEPVLAIGNPFGIGQTVTSGIVSGLGRSDLHIENLEDFIQTDASINPGNSGGPLINTDGKMIGVNTAILSPAGGNIGIGFAIPTNMARSVMMQLIKYGAIHRGFMGVVVNDIAPDIAQSLNVREDSGALVALVTPNSPAAKAGIKVGDIIISLNGKPIKNAAAVKNYIGLQQVGATLNVVYLRNGEKFTAHLVTIDPDVFQRQSELQNPFLFGIDMQNFEAQTTMAGYIQGVQVARIQPDSPGWRAGLRDGDVVLSANQQAVKKIDDLKNAVKLNNQQLLLNIFRPSNNAGSYIVIY